MPDAPPITAVPFIDLARQHAEQQEALEAALLSTFRKGAYCNGPAVQAFERECEAWLGQPVAAIACSNGTDALVLAIRGLGLAPGQQVLTPGFSFFASGSAICLAGGTPVFADVDPATYCVSRATLEAAWKPGIAGILVVHLYGHPAPMEEIMAFAKEKGIWVLEDCAQAFGARINGQTVGTFGDAAGVSFYPTKNLNAAGDAGLILAKDPAVAERIRLLRVHGERPRYTHSILGGNHRMDDLQAAILSVKLPRLDHWNAERRLIASEYEAAWRDLPLRLPPLGGNGVEPIFHQFTIACDRRDAVKDHLTSLGVGCGVYYPVPLHAQPLFGGMPSPDPCPVSTRLSTEVLSLPIFPQLHKEERIAVISAVRSFFL
ncbi:MAG: DegT/DnrJ/EryC1/StrS family aminotransferase [bacterium]